MKRVPFCGKNQKKNNVSQMCKIIQGTKIGMRSFTCCAGVCLA
jgi:hypothetical protein